MLIHVWLTKWKIFTIPTAECFIHTVDAFVRCVTLTHCCKGLKTFFVEAKEPSLVFISEHLSSLLLLAFSRREKYRSAAFGLYKGLPLKKGEKMGKGQIGLSNLDHTESDMIRFDGCWSGSKTQCGITKIFREINFLSSYCIQ